MVFLNYSTMQMVAKIVYYGPGLCGKTTNLKEIYRKTSVKSRGEMVSLETETDRTLFFDLLPMDVGVIGGFKTKFQLYTVPGQVFYNSTRKLVLRGVDGIVFVADSQIPMLDANLDSYENLKENLDELGLSLNDVPLVFQYNKRDLPNIHTVEKLNAVLNDFDRPYIESSALKGIGVFETLKEISKQTLLKLRAKAVGNELKKKETVALKVRGSENQEKIKSELEKETQNHYVEEEHTVVKEDPSSGDETNPDAIPEHVSFDTYELDDDGNITDPGLQTVTASTFGDDPDATDPSLGPVAESRAAALQQGSDDPTLDDFELDLPEEDVLTDTDELDLSALKDLKDQVTGDLPDTGDFEEIASNSFDLPATPEIADDELSDTADLAGVSGDSFDLPSEPEELGSISESSDFSDITGDSFELPETPDDAADALPDTPQEDLSTEPIIQKDSNPTGPPESHMINNFEEGEELQLDESSEDSDAENTAPIPIKKQEELTNLKEDDTVVQEMVSVKTPAQKKSAVSTTLKELENLNLKVPRPKTTKLTASTASVDDLLTGLVGSKSKKKTKTQKLKVKLPHDFDQAQINCIFLDANQNVVHTQLEKVSAVENGKGKYQIKVILDVEIDS